MAQITMQRDRTPPSGTTPGTEFLLPNMSIESLTTPESIAAGDSVSISGRLDWTRYDFPVPSVKTRIRITGTGISDIIEPVGSVGRGESVQFSSAFSPSVTPGRLATYSVVAEYQPALRNVWRKVDRQSVSVDVQTEQDEQVDAALRFTPWVVAGGIGGTAYSSYSYGRVEPAPVLGGAAVGVFGKEYSERVGLPVPDLPDISNARVALVGGTVLAGALLLNQGSRYVPGIE